jgi:small subunit ribosomal protein S6
MRRYETIIITDPDLSAEQREPIVKRVQDVISQEDGYLALTDEWGARKLAYEIKKKQRGFYTRFDFCGTAATVDEIERFFRIDDRVLKYMTVLLDNAADIDKIKEEIAATQKTVAAPPESAQPTEDQAPPKTTETVETETPEDQQASAEEQTQLSEEPADVDESQTPAPQADEDTVAPGEVKEENK